MKLAENLDRADEINQESRPWLRALENGEFFILANEIQSRRPELTGDELAVEVIRQFRERETDLP